MNRFSMGLVAAFSMSAAVGWAQIPTTQPEGPGMKMSGAGTSSAMGAHDMTATVSGIDAKTGLINVDAGGMALTLHFPPTSLAGLKVGDKILISLSFKKV